MFEAVILCGGFGTRLKEVSGDIPKPMVEVAGTPFLYRLMQKLENYGCKKIVLSLGYQAQYVIDCVRRDAPVECEVVFVVEDKPLGTGGAIKKSAQKINSKKFLVLNGDSYSDIDFLDFFQAGSNVDLLISGVEVSDASRYGTLKLSDANKVEALIEKGITGKGIINSGIYVVSKSEVLAFPKETFSFEQDFVQTYNGRFKACVTDGYFIDIGIPEDYYAACHYFS